MKRRLSDSITRAEQVARREELETPSTADDVQCFDPEPAAFDATPTPFELELNSLEDVFDIGADTWDKIALTKAELGRLGCNLLIDSFVKDFSSTLPSTSPHSDRLQQVSSSLASLLVLDPFPPASEFSPRVRALLSILSHLRDRPASRTIVIVDKKRDAKLLPWILLHADALRDWVVPECLFRTKKRRKAGTETNEASSSPSIHSPSLTIYFLSPGKSLDAFRAGNVNVLFATSNIAKALDVSACDLVVQFDGADGCVLAARFLDAGIRLVTLVETTNAGDASMDAEQDGPDIEPHPSPSARSTAPPFNLAQAAFLLDRFCSRLPRDPYASPPRPSFTLTPTPSGFLASVLLPIISALGPSPRRFGGATSATKRRAKQAAAFAACEALQQAGALDDLRADEPVDDDEVGPADVLDRHEMVEVEFDNIWGNVLAKDSPVWLNTLEVCEPGAALVVVGLVAGSSLGLYEGGAGNREGGGNGGTSVRLVSCVELSFVNPAEQAVRLEGLRALNFECVKTAVNRRVDDAPFYALFAPLTTDGSIDWTTVSNAFAPTTSATLLPSCIVAISSRRVEHRLYTFKSIRTDVSSLSPIREIEVDLESRLSANELAKFDSYVKFLRIKYSVVISDTEAEEILELESVDTTIPSHLRPRPSPQPSFRRHFPLSLCRTTSLPSSFWRIILVSPFLLRTLHDEIRARRAIAHLDLPPIHIPLLIQALTPPGAVIDFDYENLETLGGSLLQLFTSVHLYLSHPYSTEGGLSTLRRHLISNAFLQQRTLAIGLAPFLLPERFRLATWVPPESDQCDLAPDGLRTKRMIPRRALSDCVESVLAAGFLSGGVRMALMVGGRLGLEVGGEWEGRVPRVANDLERGEGMERLEEVVGYSFECPRLLRQALTHRGVMGAPTNCYEREEFLGDALLDFFVSNHLWTTFPGISSQNLTSLRTRLVSNAALAFVAIRTIEVHRNLIHDSKGLQLAIDEAVVQAKGMSWEDFDDVTWLWDPPKVLGDLVESLLGAIFVDSGCKIDTVLAAATAIFVDVLPLLKNEAPRDPISRLKLHVQSLNCQQTTLSTTPRTSSLPPSASYRYHKYPLFTASHSSQAVAGQLAARGALAVLESPAFDELKARCDCSSKRKADVFLKELKEFKKARMAVVEEPGREGAGREAEGESSGIDSDTDGEEELIVSRVSNLSARGVSSV